MDRNTAAEHFAKMLLEVGVQGPLQEFYDSMDDPLGPEKERWLEAKEWHEKQSEEGKQRLRFLVEEAIIRAVFHIAANLDGMQGFRDAGAHQIDFAVKVRVYESTAAIENETPDETIEICPTMHGDEVHDIFLNLIDDAKAAETSP